jgi:hypothetical protein
MDWITDRLPTEADADGEGEVRIPAIPGSRPNKRYELQHYSLVVANQPWWSHWADKRVAAAAAQAPSEPPAPAPPAERKIKQFVYVPKTEDMGEKVIALCNDGTLWYASPGWLNWHSFAPIPQPKQSS